MLWSYLSWLSLSSLETNVHSLFITNCTARDWKLKIWDFFGIKSWKFGVWGHFKTNKRFIRSYFKIAHCLGQTYASLRHWSCGFFCTDIFFILLLKSLDTNSSSCHPKCSWVFSSSEQIWRNLALHHLLTMQWMGAVRMRVKTSDKNITIIHK